MLHTYLYLSVYLSTIYIYVKSQNPECNSTLSSREVTRCKLTLPGYLLIIITALDTSSASSLPRELSLGSRFNAVEEDTTAGLGSYNTRQILHLCREGRKK